MLPGQIRLPPPKLHHAQRAPKTQRASSDSDWKPDILAVERLFGIDSRRFDHFVEDRKRIQIVPKNRFQGIADRITRLQTSMGQNFSADSCETMMRLLLDGVPADAFRSVRSKQGPGIFVDTRDLVPEELHEDDRTYWVKFKTDSSPGETHPSTLSLNDTWHRPLTMEFLPFIQLHSPTTTDTDPAGQGNHNRGVFLVYLKNVTGDLRFQFSFPFVCKIPMEQGENEFLEILRNYWISSRLNIGPHLLGWACAGEYRALILSAVGGDLAYRPLGDLPDIVGKLRQEGYQPNLQERLKCLTSRHGSFPINLEDSTIFAQSI